MNNGEIEIVLNELLQVQKESNRVHNELGQYIKKVVGEYESNEKKIAETTDILEKRIAALQESIEKSSAEIKLFISTKQMIVLHKKQFQLFPAFNIKEYYRVYAHLMKYLVVLLLSWKLLALLREVFVKNHLI